MRKLEDVQVRLRVAEVAKEKKLSDLELAHLSGVGATVIRRMMADGGNIYLTQLARVAMALEVPICQLIDETPKDTKDGEIDR